MGVGCRVSGVGLNGGRLNGGRQNGRGSLGGCAAGAPPRPRLGPCYLLTYPLTHLPTYLLARDWVFVHLGVENVEVALGEMVEDLVQQLLVMVARALDHAYLLVVLEVVLAGLR